MKVSRALRRRNVFPDLQGRNKEEVLREIAGRLRESGELSARLAKEVFEALLAREKIGTTGIGSGVAIPHVKLKGGPEETVVAIARSVGGVDFAAVDGGKVFVFFVVISPDDRAADHLAVLQSISTLVRDSYRNRLLLGSRTPEDFLDLFKEPEGG